mmetsp:Transcript_28696/g.44963  ORF Transcript_28696/g.44963 Transcript_28696/m.44963 type:complete len:222 (-) Transcript_28696:2547-3212(-)
MKNNKTYQLPIKEWVPVTRLGRLVKKGKISSLEEIYYHSIPIKEEGIIDFFIKDSLKEEVLKIMPVQKQTRAGQRTRFKAFVIIGDYNGHIGLGIKTAKDVTGAIKGALLASKLSIIPAKRGFWGEREGIEHTFPMKVTGKCGSIRVRCIPAPRGTGLVAAIIPKKILNMAGYSDAFTSSKGRTRTFGNFAKATYHAIYLTYALITPDQWLNRKILCYPLE